MAIQSDFVKSTCMKVLVKASTLTSQEEVSQKHPSTAKEASRLLAISEEIATLSLERAKRLGKLSTKTCFPALDRKSVV